MKIQKQVKIINKEELQVYEKNIRSNAELTINKLKLMINQNTGLEILFKLKFKKCGYEPLFGYELNIIEQLNQMFTYIVSLKALYILLEKYKNKEFVVNFGTQGGYDIISDDETIICECFASTNPMSNCKIKKDLERLKADKIALKKYEFFYSLEANETTLENLRNNYPDIDIIRINNVSII
ncbi:hypothetical protein [Clostridium aquiflavi]|uniref:DarT domain-containing protein n=1 Tax=Clostridium aquiflavi TaxID=3073603 RepID=A0ABU1ED93_9CLOT|nr:hypothetical protein [Clostridium sp. 5N-1]MDR5586112.1 hypothetical protein [Clostridium sp. 5N-1]